MFVDASALTAMLVNEQDSREFLRRIADSSIRFTSPLSVWEATVATTRVVGLSVGAATVAVENFLAFTRIEVRPIPAEARALALEAFDRFGKGRHPAALNFGDCFSYACARLAGVPLLYKGADFSHTDIEAA